MPYQVSHSRFQRALDFVLSRQLFGMKLGLDNIRFVAAALGNPQDQYPTIHVAGTNGKGSTCSYIASILQVAGYRVGLFTSPHLSDFRERIRINGVKIEPEAIVAFIESHRRLLTDSKVTFFEVTAALAFWHFARRQVDIAVIETGLGGRLDATNILTPEVAVITNIALEHTHILGRTIYKIAGEKAGIIKPGVPLVTGVADDGNDAARRFREVCRRKGAPLVFCRPGQYRYHYDGVVGRLQILGGPLTGLAAPLSLAGQHQAANAFLAVRTIGILRSAGYRVPVAAIVKGLKNSYWPARFMTIRKRPTVILDVSHNPAGFATLANLIRERFPGRRCHFLVGMVEMKRGEECLELVAPLARSFSVTPLLDERSDDPYRLISRLGPAMVPVRVFPNAADAYTNLLKNCHPTDILIITGSHYLIGELTPLIGQDGF